MSELVKKVFVYWCLDAEESFIKIKGAEQSEQTCVAFSNALKYLGHTSNKNFNGWGVLNTFDPNQPTLAVLWDCTEDVMSRYTVHGILLC